MRAVKAHFDGKSVVLSQDLADVLPPGDVIVVFSAPNPEQDANGWLKVQEGAFARTWGNAEDAVYDDL